MTVPLYQAKADLLQTLGHPVRIRVLELLHSARHILASMITSQDELLEALRSTADAR